MYKILFLDIGGVLLTNGWDRQARARAYEYFHLDPHAIESRHQLTFSTYELGKITLEEYLQQVIFFEQRIFTRQQFKDFMYAQSQPFPDTISLFMQLKQQYGLKMVAVSNEGRELNAYRIPTFKLSSLFDFFISSCYVQLRKPDPAIFLLALDMVQCSKEETLYIDDRLPFLEVAKNLGIRGIQHIDALTTQQELAKLGLR